MTTIVTKNIPSPLAVSQVPIATYNNQPIIIKEM